MVGVIATLLHQLFDVVDLAQLTVLLAVDGDSAHGFVLWKSVVGIQFFVAQHALYLKLLDSFLLPLLTLIVQTLQLFLFLGGQLGLQFCDPDLSFRRHLVISVGVAWREFGVL